MMAREAALEKNVFAHLGDIRSVCNMLGSVSDENFFLVKLHIYITLIAVYYYGSGLSLKRLRLKQGTA